MPIKGRNMRKANEALPKKNSELYEYFFWMPPVDMRYPEELKERTDEFRQFCTEKNIAPLWEDYCFAVGYTRDYMCKVMAGTRGTTFPKETREIIIRTRSWLGAVLAQIGIEYPEKSVTVIWQQKNNYGYRDNIEILPVAQIEAQSPMDVLKRYALASIVTEDIPQLPQKEEVVDGTYKVVEPEKEAKTIDIPED